MDSGKLMQIDIFLGAVAGAVSGASDVLGDYQDAYHARSLAAYSVALDLENEGHLAELSQSHGINADKVVERYRVYRDAGADPASAINRTHRDVRLSLDQKEAGDR